MNLQSRRQYLSTLTVAGLSGCLIRGDSLTDVPRVETLQSGTVPARPDDKTALIDFFATWCAPCKPQMAELRTIRNQFPELHMLSVTREDDETAVKQFWETYDGTWLVGVDPSLQVFQHYEVTSVPTKLLIDTSGSIRWRHIGLATAETIHNLIAELDNDE